MTYRMCIQMVSDDCKKTAGSIVLRKQTSFGRIVRTKANKSKNPYVICHYI